MNKTAAQIFEEGEATDALVELLGNRVARIQRIAAYESGKAGDLVFAPNDKAFEKALTNGVSLIIIPEKLNCPQIQSLNGTAVIRSSNISVSHARLKQKYAEHDYTQSGWEIHSSLCHHSPKCGHSPQHHYRPQCSH